MGLVVRDAGPEEAPTLARVAAETFALACPPHMTQERVDAFVADVLSRERFEAYLADPVRHLLVAERCGTVVGYTMLVAGEPADEDVAAALTLRPTVELSKIYVLPEAHGTGAAWELMARSLAWAASTGAAGMWLGVNQQNARAQRFYGKSGFTVVGTKRFLVGGVHEDDFVMERPLQA